MIDHQQVAVAYLVGAILRLALAVAVAGVTGDARVAHPCRAQTLAWLLVVGVEVFEEVLTHVEVVLHACLFGSGCQGRIAGLVGGTEFSTRIPLVGSEIAGSLAEDLVGGCQRPQVTECL